MHKEKNKNICRQHNHKFYPQTFLEKCKCTQEQIKIESYINEDLENSESDSDSDNEE